MLVEYVRGKKRNPFATLIARKTEEGHVRIGWSKYADDLEKIPFTKEIGKKIALSSSCGNVVFTALGEATRLINRCNASLIDYSFVPVELQRITKRFILRTTKYFKQPPCNILVCGLQFSQYIAKLERNKCKTQG